MEIEKFKSWLENRGAEILPNTSEYEVLRFKGLEVGVLYGSGKVNSGYTAHAINCYKSNSTWNGSPIKVAGRQNYKKKKIKLIDRDGTDCWLCGKAMGEDLTVEHLISLTQGGTNKLSNMVLVHFACNNDLGNMPLNQKVKMAIQKRIKKAIQYKYKSLTLLKK